jgi:hypothetical protein
MPISKRPPVSTDSECASQAKLQGVRGGEAYTHVPTCRSARVAAAAGVGPGAGCPLLNVGHQEFEKPLSAIRRAWSRHAGRLVLTGATTPNRKLLATAVASLSVILAVLSIYGACSCPPMDCRVGPNSSATREARPSGGAHLRAYKRPHSDPLRDTGHGCRHSSVAVGLGRVRGLRRVARCGAVCRVPIRGRRGR